MLRPYELPAETGAVASLLTPEFGEESEFFGGLEVFAAFVVVVGPDGDLFGPGIMVVSGKNGGRRANIVHKADREQGGTFATGGEVEATEIRKGSEDGIGLVARGLEEPRKLGAAR